MADASPSAANRREQLRHLNDSLVSGSLSRQEYDELLPFVASPASQQPPQPQSQERGEGEDAAFAAALAQAQQPSDPAASASEAESQLSSNSPQQQQRSVHFAAPEPIEAPPQYQILAPVAAANVGAGLQLRCPACGTSNDTARGPRCYVCSSKLTVADELSAAVAARSSYGGRSSRAARWPIVTATAPPSGVFSAAENGRVVLLNGYFSCAMETTQVVATADGSACQVFVMCCTWQPRDGDNQQQLLATCTT
ncbi:myosin-like protein [Phytophthora cinnamomi]|uniref:myosin-like protein n=1 Tax=Phytophthora cinnamomi TaxID=4785 RepID=UPI003559E8C3|nr:myosin-like protein [Phytophthora cinnamomi]